MAVTINGSAGVTTNSGAVYNGLQTDTAKSATSTSVDFTGIPSWVKRITVMFSGVSTNGTSIIQFQLGDSGGIETTGYAAQANTITTTPAVTATTSTSGFPIGATASVAAMTYSGHALFTKLVGDTWVFSSVIIRDSTASSNFGAGSKTLSDTLTQVRITTVNGTDTFDAGTINIIYE